MLMYLPKIQSSVIGLFLSLSRLSGAVVGQAPSLLPSSEVSDFCRRVRTRRVCFDVLALRGDACSLGQGQVFCLDGRALSAGPSHRSPCFWDFTRL